MFFGIIITRILFIACMVFIIGYVFGNFSKNSTLAVISKIAVVAAIVLFIATNVFAFRSNGWRNRHFQPHDYGCYYQQKDSVLSK